MKNITPIVAALLVMAVAAITLFASGNVLSFSLPTTDDVASVTQQQNAVPPEPQDFSVSSAYYYFGPDFMCLTYVDTTTIECQGSDAHNVVSAAPRVAGFTQIDGGDTYACAWNQRVRGLYCWGSITRSPSSVQPTATTAPTATTEPTATTVPGATPPPTPTITPTPPPTATPVPIYRGSCHIPRSGSAAYPLTLTSKWKSSCTLDDGTPYIWDQWRQKGTGAVTITAKSDGDPRIYLSVIDDSKSPGDDGWVTLLAYNDDIDEPGGNYDAQIVYTLEDGKHYWISVSPYRNSSRDSFTLTYTSSSTDLGWTASHTPFDETQMQSMMESAAAK